MPVQRQTIVQPAAAPTKSKGARKDINIRSSFPESPIFKGELTDEERKKVFDELALNGTVNNGHGLNSFNRDYEDAPDLSEVETGGGGKPSSPFTPNLTSPGPGSLNPADQPIYNGELPNPEFNSEFGVGMGGLVSPSETSVEIAKQGTLGTYISGRSYQGSDGKA
tara:strand:- start:286 stop:783 length:498 start_codon:yes stop_codon:yes gene_type:complete